MEFTPQDKVAELFLKTCRELRAMGATRVEGLGFGVTFDRLPSPSVERKPDEREPPKELSGDALAVQRRAQLLANGGVR